MRTPINLKTAIWLALFTLLLASLQPVAAGEAPFYINKPIADRCFGYDVVSMGGLRGVVCHQPTLRSEIELSDLTGSAPATTVMESILRFPARAAQAINNQADQDLDNLSNNGHGGAEEYGIALLANLAYGDFFTNTGTSARLRQAIRASIKSQIPYDSGTNNDYDMLLQMYLPIVYKYYRTEPELCDYIIDNLLTVYGQLRAKESVWKSYCFVFCLDVPETENHLLMIQTARYLTNQLLYRRPSPGYPSGHNPLFDNRRNGDSDKSILPTTEWLLSTLREYLRHDFLEYNGRPYQDMVMFALLNLADYAYDDDVRLAARMVLDYLSAKVAVSSNDLRRASPFRRRNELNHYGPTILGNSNFLGSPLVDKFGSAPGTTDPYDHDPQIAWFAQLAGNTGILASANPPRAANKVQSDYAVEMLFAGVHDYRVPEPILDLFINPESRRFYQSLTHDANHGEMAQEIYFASPSYLLTAGGNSTSSAYQVQLKLLGIGPKIGKSLVGWLGEDSGAAMPTSLMPTGYGFTLAEMVQIDTYGATGKGHLCVAPDFACGRKIYIPPAMMNDPSTIKWGRWTFIDRSNNNSNKYGYYLAIYNDNSVALLEAYDTWHNSSLTFSEFIRNIQDKNWTAPVDETGSKGTYVTQSGQSISYVVSLYDSGLELSYVSSTFGKIGKPDFLKFADGTIMQSDLGSATIDIKNPALGKQFTLSMPDKFHPRRISESGEVARAGFDLYQEVWIDFDSPTSLSADGDFYHPFKNLAQAQNKVATGGTVLIMPGAKNEAITLNKPMTLKSFPGSAVIGRP
jgi:hypothetical protein